MTNKKLKRLGRKELRNLDSLATEFMGKVAKDLGKIRKQEVRLYITMQDRYRLLKLKVWADKYKVPLIFILSTLIPLWESFIQRRSRQVKREGLNVRVATLTGKKSEQFLQEAIRKEFPDGANKRLWIAKHRERILATKVLSLQDKELLSRSQKVSGLEEFTTPRKYIAYYRRRVRYLNSVREKVIQQMEERPYRSNPFVERTV